MDSHLASNVAVRSLSPQEADLKDQLHVLKEREMFLSQKLALEKERRLHVERTAEMQKQACMELKLLLDKERKLSGVYAKAPELGYSPGTLRRAPPTGMEQILLF